MSLPKWINKTYPFSNPDDGLMILEALKIAWEALGDITDNFDESRDDCGVCDKGIFSGHTKYCVVPGVLEAMRRIGELGK